MNALRELDPEIVYQWIAERLRDACTEMLGRMDVCRFEEKRAYRLGDYRLARRWDRAWTRRRKAHAKLIARRRALIELRYGGRA